MQGYFILKYFIIAAMLVSCSSGDTVPGQTTDKTEEITGSFIYGLWSRDSGNVLSNTGYYFKSDGTVDVIPAEESGNWKLEKADSLKLLFSFLNEHIWMNYHIDSLSNSRMVLTDTRGTHVFRKVPFGENYEPVVVKGFSGTLTGGESREYYFESPGAKRMSVRITSPDSSASFRLFDNEKEITSAAVQSWSGILIRAGRYTAKVSRSAGGSHPAAFDMKVLSY